MSRIGPYQVLDVIARGGTGAVMRCRDPQGQLVALKLLIHRAADERMRKRFGREVEALIRLRDHRGIVPIRAYGTHNGAPYLVMPYVPGESLRARLRAQGPLAPKVAAQLVEDLARAIHHAHQAEVLHRDLKPDNVLLAQDDSGQERPLLIDFGMVKSLNADASRLSQTGLYLGTPGYWPPEQAKGELQRIGPRSDVYGLGAILYACLAARPPFQGDSVSDFLALAELDPDEARGKLEPPGEDERINGIVQRCLEQDPDDRYPSALALAEDLALFRRGLRSLSRRPTKAARAASRQRLAGGVVLTGALLAGGLVAVAGPAEPGPDPRVDPGLPPLIAESEPSPQADPLPEPAEPTAPPERPRPPLRDTEAARALIGQAMGAHESGDLPGALGLYIQACAADPELAEAWSGRAQVALQLNDPQGALNAADEALAREVDDAEALLVRARSLLQLGQRQSALSAAERLVTLRREWVPGLLTRGFLYHLVGDHSAAAQDARAILELHDDQPSALFLLGSATLDLPDGDPAEALALLRRAAERLHPRDPERATVERRIQEARQRANR